MNRIFLLLNRRDEDDHPLDEMKLGIKIFGWKQFRERIKNAKLKLIINCDGLSLPLEFISRESRKFQLLIEDEKHHVRSKVIVFDRSATKNASNRNIKSEEKSAQNG